LIPDIKLFNPRSWSYPLWLRALVYTCYREPLERSKGGSTL